MFKVSTLFNLLLSFFIVSQLVRRTTQDLTSVCLISAHRVMQLMDQYQMITFVNFDRLSPNDTGKNFPYEIPPLCRWSAVLNNTWRLIYFNFDKFQQCSMNKMPEKSFLYKKPVWTWWLLKWSSKVIEAIKFKKKHLEVYCFLSFFTYQCGAHHYIRFMRMPTNQEVAY